MRMLLNPGVVSVPRGAFPDPFRTSGFGHWSRDLAGATAGAICRYALVRLVKE